MEKTIETPLQTNINQTQATIIDSHTPPHNLLQPTKCPVSEVCKLATPDRLKIPKAFKYPERYTSPTDLVMSPVSRGLLARSRKASPLLPPSNSQPQRLALFRI